MATLRLVTLTASGVGMGKTIGYAWLVDAEGKNLASLVVNDVNKLPLVREIVTGLAPQATVVEQAETAHARAA